MATTPLVALGAAQNPLPRKVIEQAIERLIAILDAIDGDPDSELVGDEADADGDELDQAFPEWWAPGLMMPGALELANEGCFDPVTLLLASRLEDTELDDFREREEFARASHGLDQSRPIDADNPPLALMTEPIVT